MGRSQAWQQNGGQNPFLSNGYMGRNTGNEGDEWEEGQRSVEFSLKILYLISLWNKQHHHPVELL